MNTIETKFALIYKHNNNVESTFINKDICKEENDRLVIASSLFFLPDIIVLKSDVIDIMLVPTLPKGTKVQVSKDLKTYKEAEYCSTGLTCGNKIDFSVYTNREESEVTSEYKSIMYNGIDITKIQHYSMRELIHDLKPLTSL